MIVHSRRSRQKNSSLSITSYQKASEVFEEKELDKHSAVRSCQDVVMVKGSGVDEWPCMKLVRVFRYILVDIYIGIPIKLFCSAETIIRILEYIRTRFRKRMFEY